MTTPHLLIFLRKTSKSKAASLLQQCIKREGTLSKSTILLKEPSKIITTQTIDTLKLALKWE